MLRRRASPPSSTKTDNYQSQLQRISPNHPSQSAVGTTSEWSPPTNEVPPDSRAATWAGDQCRTRHRPWTTMHHLPLCQITIITRTSRRRMNNRSCREQLRWLTACQRRQDRKFPPQTTTNHPIRLSLWARVAQCRLWPRKTLRRLNRLSNETTLSSRIGAKGLNKMVTRLMGKTPMKEKDKSSEREEIEQQKLHSSYQAVLERSNTVTIEERERISLTYLK